MSARQSLLSTHPTLDELMAVNDQLEGQIKKLLKWKQAANVLAVLILLIIVSGAVVGIVSHLYDMLPWAYHSIHDPKFEGRYIFENGKDELQIRKSGRISMIGIHGQQGTMAGKGSLPVAWKNEHEGRVFLWHGSVAFIVRLQYEPWSVQIMEEDCGAGLIHERYPVTYMRA